MGTELSLHGGNIKAWICPFLHSLYTRTKFSTSDGSGIDKMATNETVQNAPPVYDVSSDEKKVVNVSRPTVRPVS